MTCETYGSTDMKIEERLRTDDQAGPEKDEQEPDGAKAKDAPFTVKVTFRARRQGNSPDAKRREETIPESEEPIPIEIPRTKEGAYVTGHIVLALQHQTIGKGGSWRSSTWGPPGTVALLSDHPAHAQGARAATRGFAREEIVDLRPALKSASHPGATRNEPIWGATHVRAVLELAWAEALDITAQPGMLQSTFDARTMRTWLSRVERERAQTLGRKMAEANHQVNPRQWQEWLDGLTE